MKPCGPLLLREALPAPRPGWQAPLLRTWQRLAGYPGPGPLPAEIALETDTRCNGHCSFCPSRAGSDPRPPARMTPELVEDIAAELACADYRGIINLFASNEPLLDPRIEAFCRRLARAAPRAEICLFTNGRLLTPERYFALFEAGLDLLVINHYDDRLQPDARLTACLDHIARSPHPLRRHALRRTLVRLRHENAVLSSRAGQAPNRPEAASMTTWHAHGCFRPFEQMVIRADGAVSLCCNDALGAVTLGRVDRDGIAGVWQNPAYAALRAGLRREGRQSQPLCATCDADTGPLTNRARHRLAHAALALNALTLRR